MKTLIRLFGIFSFATLITLTVYWKIPLKGLIPFPGDLLVGRFFPFNTMSWEGYPTGVPYKEFINADVVRQLYPWRDLAIKQLKQGEIPWWNPYVFSGSPLLANIQSAPFYPLNLLYWLSSHQSVWILQVILQPILATTFMWIFTRELGFSKTSAALSSIAFAFSGYMIIWFELNTVGHAALWLPLILWGIERLRKTKQYRYLIPIIFGQTSSLLAGHLQTTVYVFIISLAFFVFRFLGSQRRKKTLLLSFVLANVLSLILAFPQLLPALRFIPSTPRGTQADEEIFTHFILPPKHLMTFFAHDYFGNPAVGNFWGIDYGEFMGYFGVVALFFAIISLIKVRTHEVKFFVFLAIAALLFAIPTPLPQLLRLSRIPILSTSAPSRTLFIVQFSGAVLAGFGVEKWLKDKNLKLKFPFLILGAAFAFAWMAAIIGLWRSSEAVELANWKVTLRNLIPPTAVFIATAAMLTTVNIVTISKKLKSYRASQKLYAKEDKLKPKKLSLIVIFLLALMEYSYFANKFQTFSEARFFFPQTPIYEFLSERSKDSYARFFGDYTASVTSNSWMPYQVYGVEGYDSLYIKRYGELLASSQAGLLPESVPRSDANLVKNQDDTRRRRLQDLMGVKYILDKNDNPQSDWEPEPHRFPPERYQLIWQQGKFKVYENTQALPRAFLVGEFTIEYDPQTILNLIFNPDFKLSKSIIIEEEIPIEIEESEGSVDFISYEPNQVTMQVETPTSQLLFLSDAYYPDWTATVDGKETRVYRANYTFRAIVVPPGTHQVLFKYNPIPYTLYPSR